jgi:hypothetical protein
MDGWIFIKRATTISPLMNKVFLIDVFSAKSSNDFGSDVVLLKPTVTMHSDGGMGSRIPRAIPPLSFVSWNR